ncbi:hypothetical protein K2173_027138 [Erythroxylum novogranatense]|uniref:DRBM domain-containing protein n=1 Tax=Erythroxylum novogranatense TaxID=1862640 RepID=A0AAV8TZL2_9ROSI|nr:hypothetical protein K2173_027138 [Erythroxylum novogranatense]
MQRYIWMTCMFMADMFKNQLQELAQRSCFNLPQYACVREGPDHAPRFKASVNFNGEIFDSPSYSSTLRQAEHAAAEVALNVLSSRGPSRSLTARVLDETGIYKNLLQETAHRAGLNLPVYTTVRSGPGHAPIFTCTVELAGMSFTGDPAKTKKQAEKNAAIAAWSALKTSTIFIFIFLVFVTLISIGFDSFKLVYILAVPNLDSKSRKEVDNREEYDQAVVARVLSNLGSIHESKQARKRDHNQARRRVFKGYRDTVSATSSSATSNTTSYQHWRLLDLLLDTGLDDLTIKQNSFVSLLPPPPPRTASKILPPTSLPEEISSPSKAKVQLNIVPHTMKDVEKRIGSLTDVVKRPIEEGSSNSSNSSNVHRPCSMFNTRGFGAPSFDNITKNDYAYITKTQFGSKTPSSVASKSSEGPSSSTYTAMPMNTGRFKPHRIAPAVQIRSVIPVCAAPPPQMRAPSTSASTASATPCTTTQISTRAGAESATFNKPESNSNSQLSTGLNSKLP